jgi:hypothetical protein
VTATWGEPVRLRGGYLTHYADQPLPWNPGARWLAHGCWAWTDTCLPAGRNNPPCRRCLNLVPSLADRDARLAAEAAQRASRGDQTAQNRAQDVTGTTERAVQPFGVDGDGSNASRGSQGPLDGSGWSGGVA